jgi:phosphoadenosine phosphosulfate reductase
MDKIQRTIESIQKAEKLALQYSPDGFHLAFSGGKDSQVIYHLSKMAGVKFKAVMQVTTIDPPELMKFVRRNYPDVIMERPEINFYELIKKKHILPTMKVRYCCQYLKEGAGVGKVVMTGIRRAESSKRAKRNELELLKHKYSNTLDQFNIDIETKILCINGKDKIIYSPIIDWTSGDVWRFIRGNNIKYCELYDKGYHRIGCMFCPMSSVRSKQRDRQNYPGVESQIKKSIQYCIENYNYGKDFGFDSDDIFNWWISNDSSKKYKASKSQQTIDFF